MITLRLEVEGGHMITIMRTGDYRLIETKHNTKILYLDNDVFAWLEPTGIGEILVTSYDKHTADCILSVGEYLIYDVEDEPELSDQLHLELSVGGNIWQGYLLLTGLPTDDKKRSRIIPTHEIITGNPEFAGSLRAD